MTRVYFCDKDTIRTKTKGESLSQDEVNQILRNLRNFGIEDQNVRARVEITREGRHLRYEDVGPIPLSVVCTRHRQILTEVPHDFRSHEKANADIKIYINQQEIGHVDRSGIFYFDEASDLRTAFAWLLATGIGRYRYVSVSHLNTYARVLREVATKGNISRDLLRRALLSAEIYVDISFKLAKELFQSTACRG